MNHFISLNPNAIPLILVHGWPGSVFEFHHIIPLLSNQFHIVVPSLPGYGWSDKTKEPGMHCEKVAFLLNELMIKLGYNYYIAQGGDWGAIITREMAYHHSDHVIALHQNMPLYMPSRRKFNFMDIFYILYLTNLSDLEKQQLERLIWYATSGSGYMLSQASKPHTIAHGLMDSPAGLLSWISEKIYLWSDRREALSKDDVITNVMIYWVTGTIASSMRLYYESLPLGKEEAPMYGWESQIDEIHVPSGFAFSPKEIICFPLRWLSLIHTNVVHATEMQYGGHFAAWEQPKLLAEDLNKFVFSSLKLNYQELCMEAKKREKEGKYVKKRFHLSVKQLLLAFVILFVFIWRVKRKVLG